MTAAAWPRTGSRTTKIVPEPSWVSNAMLPPWRSTIADASSARVRAASGRTPPEIGLMMNAIRTLL